MEGWGRGGGGKGGEGRDGGRCAGPGGVSMHTLCGMEAIK